MNNGSDAAFRDYSIKRRIANALIASGYTTLGAQAAALGVHRSTAWTIVKSKHKVGRLSQKVRQKMLANPNLPPLVRKELETFSGQQLDQGVQSEVASRGAAKRMF